jgi:hypothetical protein
MRWLMIALTLCLLPTLAAANEPPSYLLLRAPEKPADPHARQGYYPGRGYAVETHAYNYGWFGAKYGKSCQRSLGYHRAYTQWKAR